MPNTDNPDVTEAPEDDNGLGREFMNYLLEAMEASAEGESSEDGRPCLCGDLECKNGALATALRDVGGMGVRLREPTKPRRDTLYPEPEFNHYSYEALDENGDSIDGFVEARDYAEAEAVILSNNYKPSNICLKSPGHYERFVDLMETTPHLTAEERSHAADLLTRHVKAQPEDDALKKKIDALAAVQGRYLYEEIDSIVEEINNAAPWNITHITIEKGKAFNLTDGALNGSGEYPFLHFDTHVIKCINHSGEDEPEIYEFDPNTFHSLLAQRTSKNVEIVGLSHDQRLRLEDLVELVEQVFTDPFLNNPVGRFIEEID